MQRHDRWNPDTKYFLRHEMENGISFLHWFLLNNEYVWKIFETKNDEHPFKITSAKDANPRCTNEANHKK